MRRFAALFGQIAISSLTTQSSGSVCFCLAPLSFSPPLPLLPPVQYSERGAESRDWTGDNGGNRGLAFPPNWTLLHTFTRFYIYHFIATLSCLVAIKHRATLLQPMPWRAGRPKAGRAAPRSPATRRAQSRSLPHPQAPSGHVRRLNRFPARAHPPPLSIVHYQLFIAPAPPSAFPLTLSSKK